MSEKKRSLADDRPLVPTLQQLWATAAGVKAGACAFPWKHEGQQAFADLILEAIDTIRQFESMAEGGGVLLSEQHARIRVLEAEAATLRAERDELREERAAILKAVHWASGGGRSGLNRLEDVLETSLHVKPVDLRQALDPDPTTPAPSGAKESDDDGA